MINKKIHGFILVMLLTISLFSYAQVFGDTKDSLISSQQDSSKQVTSLEIKGNKLTNDTVILAKIKTRAGTIYSKNIISDDVKRLYATGFFNEVNVDTEPYQDGVKVIFTVQEKPIVDKILFSGNKVLRTDFLKPKIKLKESQYFDEVTLKDDIDTLKKAYDLKGFTDVKIQPKTDLDKTTNKIKVTITIDEGKRIKIKKITFTGNKAFPSKRILKIIKTRAAGFLNAGFLKEETLKEDMEKIKAFYQRQGYSDVTVEYQIQQDPKTAFLYLSINIHEGKKYMVGTVSIRGNIVVGESQIREKLEECTLGKVFSQEAMRIDSANIQSLYFDKGYIFAEIRPTSSLNSLTDKVDIIYQITENDVAYVNKIVIRGNSKTRDMVIRRELRIHPGDKFDGEKLRRSKERLQNLGYFEEVDYDYEPTSESNKKDLVVNVKETKTGEFSFGGGYSTVDKLVGFAAIEQKNFDWANWPYFTGGGQDLKFRAQIGSISQDFVLSFTEPWLFDYPILFGFDLYKTVHDRDTDVGYGYSEKRLGGDIRLGKELSEYWRTDSVYKLEDVTISDVDDSALDDLKKETGKNTISSLDVGLTYDTRDNVFAPRKGFFWTGSAGLAGSFLSGDKNFSRIKTEAGKYFPFFKSCSLEIRGRAGIENAFGKTDEVPIYERFFVGGSDTVRGYNERKIGPIDSATSDPIGGDAMFVGNVEYTFPLVEFIKGALFFDIGGDWKKPKDFGTDLFSGTGVGVRIKTPMGPLKLDYGYPLKVEPGKESRQGRFHFSMGYGF